MTEKMSYLSDFEELNGRYVSFGGNPKGGKISGKGKIQTVKLDFDDVYFVMELKFNLFSVSQMCDKKNNVLFTDTECLVLSPEFKLPVENQVLLRVLRENNMYNVDLKNIGIKREFSVPRTPQQNSIAERKNKTLIEAARTILADSLLPIPFWAEAVNTACYVQNRVLVTKPQNKTPYELLLGRTPSIGFMRPFGCLVTILDTLDPLGKFNGKVDEGFLVGYSVSSKAFRVFNSRTRIVQETLHINFLENKPNVACNGPTWLFDIDTLIKTMNYQPVTAGNQSNPSACVQEQFDAKKAREDDVQQYVLFPVWSSGSTNPHNTDDDATFGEFEDFFETRINEINVVDSPVPAVGQILKLEDITYSDDEEDIGAEADFTNLEITIIVSPIPTTRVHKDHHVTLIIGDLSTATQTRSITRVAKDQRTKWVFRNKKDERGIVVRNKAQLVTQGHTQEEDIEYEEVFALIARIEAIRLFLAYASFIGFMVYQMDVKSAFLYGTIEEKVYVCQHLRFEDPDYPDKVYIVVKALYGLHQAPKAWYETLANYLLENDLCKAFKKLMKDKFQMSLMGELTFFLGLQVKLKQDGIFISQDKYVAEILRKFGLTDGKLASTLIDTEKHLLKDPNCDDVNVHTYRSMIVKRIFRYSKGKPHLGLWYPKDSPYNLLAYLDSDYAGASLDRKSTIGGCQFLECRLISWQCKKKIVLATSSNEAEVGKGFLGVDTPLFEGMIKTQQADEGVVDVNVDDVPANEGASSVVVDDVPAAVDEPSIQSPTPPTNHHHHHKIYLLPH
nr:retrovirus-related Pol polyprotein from transposon TNT 1-94 [Tanacetum cinerariifolium]